MYFKNERNEKKALTKMGVSSSAKFLSIFFLFLFLISVSYALVNEGKTAIDFLTSVDYLKINSMSGTYEGGTTGVKVYDNGTIYASEDVRTGWIEYIDNEYTTSNRLTISTTLVNFSMTNYTTRQQELPTGITNLTWYNGTHLLTERAGNSFIYRFRYSAEPQGTNIYCESYINIGGAVGQIPFRLITFPKGNGIEQIGTFTNIEYTLDTWYENGGKLQIECSGDVEFWDIELTVERLHVGRGTY